MSAASNIPDQFNRDAAEGGRETVDRNLKQAGTASSLSVKENDEAARIQAKQGGHHLPPHESDEPALDDTDRNSDKVIKPSQRKP